MTLCSRCVGYQKAQRDTGFKCFSKCRAHHDLSFDLIGCEDLVKRCSSLNSRLVLKTSHWVKGGTFAGDLTVKPTMTRNTHVCKDTCTTDVSVTEEALPLSCLIPLLKSKILTSHTKEIKHDLLQVFKLKVTH